jgi:preprotein translocase SecE subunit
VADGDRKEERSGERSRTPAQARRASRRERVAQARAQKAPPKSQGGERAARAGIGQFVRECIAELRKVQWPTRVQLWQATGVVIIVCIVIGVYIAALDAVLFRASRWLIDEYAAH